MSSLYLDVTMWDWKLMIFDDTKRTAQIEYAKWCLYHEVMILEILSLRFRFVIWKYSDLMRSCACGSRNGGSQRTKERSEYKAFGRVEYAQYVFDTFALPSVGQFHFSKSTCIFCGLKITYNGRSKYIPSRTWKLGWSVLRCFQILGQDQ